MVKFAGTVRLVSSRVTKVMVTRRPNWPPGPNFYTLSGTILLVSIQVLTLP